MRNLAIIPARSGSKGLKDKNIREICGLPLLAYSIMAAEHSKVFDEIFVSTDSEMYAEIAKKHGASVPFLRSDKNSTDKASSLDMIRESLAMYSNIGKNYDTFCLLQPTSPLRTAEDIVEAYKLFEEKKAKAVVSVCEVDHSPLWCNSLGSDGSLDGFLASVPSVPRQQLPVYYRINGAVYIADINQFLQNDDLYTTNCYAYIMDKRNSVDIDDITDFEYAEFLMSKRG